MADQDIEEILKKMQKTAYDGKSRPLSSEEMDTVRQVIQLYELFLSWGRLGKIFLWILMTLAAVVVAWSDIKEQFLP